MKIEKETLGNNIKLICVEADSFPNGIFAAHQKLHSLIPNKDGRSYYGISHGAENGKTIYKAAISELEEGEAEKLGCQSFTIQKGNYNAVLVQDYMKDMSAIGRTFHTLIADPNIDPQGYCVEDYVSQKDVKCMVKMKD